MRAERAPTTSASLSWIADTLEFDMKTKDSLVLAMVASLWASALPAAAQDAEPPAPHTALQTEPQSEPGMPAPEQIYDDAMSAYGGKDSIRAINGLGYKLDASVMGTSISMTVRWGRPGGRYMLTTMPQGDVQFGTDPTGEHAWAKMPMGFTLLEKQQADQQLGMAEMVMAMLDPTPLMKKRGVTAITTGMQTFQERECYVVQSNENGELSNAYYDIGTHMLVGLTQGEDAQQTTIVFKDWKEVEGIQFFHTIDVAGNAMPGGSVAFTISDYRINASGDDNFTLPEEVQKLVDDRNAPAPASDGSIALKDLTDTEQQTAAMILQKVRAENDTAEKLRAAVGALEQSIAVLRPELHKPYNYVIQELLKDIKAKGG